MHTPWGRNTVPCDEMGTLEPAEECTALLVAVDGTHTSEHTLTLRQVGAGGAHTPGEAVILLFGAACGTHSTGEGEESSAPLVGAGGMLVAADGTCTLEHTLTLLQGGAGGEHTSGGPVIVLPGVPCGTHSTGGGSTVPLHREVHTHQKRSRLRQQAQQEGI